MSDKPNSQPPSFTPDPNTARFNRIALIAFIVLAVVAIAVIFFLPGQVDRQREHNQVASEPDQAQVRKTEEQEAKAKEAQELLQKTLKLKARLDNEGVKDWGVEPIVTSYGEVLAALKEANTRFDDQLFDQAVKGYQETIVKLEQLANSRRERIRRAMQAGNEAFARLDNDLAKHHYQIALAADGDNSEAQIGIQRAENLHQVLAYIAQGQFHEDQGELDIARGMYNDASLLDKDFMPARERLQHVKKLILERDFRSAMSEAISALNQNEIEQARHSLAIARKLKPDAVAVLDLDRQLKNASLRFELQRLKDQVLLYEKTEQWEKAVKTYAQVLEIDANTSFAQEGKLRAERFAKLNHQVQYYLLNPDDLQTSEHKKHARSIYQMATANCNIGPKFCDHTKKLGLLIDEYSKSIQVLVKSDNLTDVTIYHVGRLGHFFEHSLKLQPGRYKAIGIRSGYRDVSVLFTVPLGSEGITLELFCKEKI